MAVDRLRVYLAGPMTGIPRFNFPAFDRAAEDLRGRGYDVVSPAETDSPEARAAALASPDGDLAKWEHHGGSTWGEVVADDVRLIADQVDAVFVMPDWQRSRGVRIETFVAYVCGKPIHYAASERRVPLSVLLRAWVALPPMVLASYAIRYLP